MNRVLLHTALHRVRAGERCWEAETAVRSVGALLLGMCAAAIAGLHRLLTQPSHPVTAPELTLAALAVLGWMFGGAALVEGPRLFKLVPVPGRGWMA